MTPAEIKENLPHRGEKNLSKEQLLEQRNYYRDLLAEAAPQKQYKEFITLRIHRAMVANPKHEETKKLLDAINAGGMVTFNYTESMFVNYVIAMPV